jgi:cysteine desulfurase/selenocysteine lyase
MCSAHKVRPTGIGVLYGKESWLEKLPPYQGGGEMIATVSFEKTTFERPPLKFEAGTPDYIATHGLAKALDYVTGLGLDNISRHERELGSYALEQLRQLPEVTIYAIPSRASCDQLQRGHHSSHGLGTLLDRLASPGAPGHHCASR